MTAFSDFEDCMDYALKEGAHNCAYDATFGEKETPALKLVRDGHYWAAKWHGEAADTCWRCAQNNAMAPS